MIFDIATTKPTIESSSNLHSKINHPNWRKNITIWKHDKGRALSKRSETRKRNRKTQTSTVNRKTIYESFCHYCRYMHTTAGKMDVHAYVWTAVRRRGGLINSFTDAYWINRHTKNRNRTHFCLRFGCVHLECEMCVKSPRESRR